MGQIVTSNASMDTVSMERKGEHVRRIVRGQAQHHSVNVR